MPWKHMWKAKMPHKVVCFVWLFAKEAVLTQYNLVKKGIPLCFRCFICGKIASTMVHLFIHCKVTKSTEEIIPKSQHILVHAWENHRSITQFGRSRSTTKNRNNKRIVPAAIWCTIWKEKNLRVFENMENTIQLVIMNCILIFDLIFLGQVYTLMIPSLSLMSQTHYRDRTVGL